MKNLVRVSQGIFSLSDATSTINLKKENIINIEDAFTNFDNIKLNNTDIKRFTNGVVISELKEKDGIYRVFNLNNDFIGIGETKDSFLKHKQLV